MKLKTFESFENDNSKVWIIGIPSGEALHIKTELLDDLYARKIVKYTTKYNNVGIFIFDDINIDLINKLINPKSESKKIVNILENNYDDVIISSLSDIIEMCPDDIEIYIQDDTIGITLDQFYLEIDISNGKFPGRYRIVIRLNGQTINKYNVSTDSDLIKMIQREIGNILLET